MANLALLEGPLFRQDYLCRLASFQGSDDWKSPATAKEGHWSGRSAELCNDTGGNPRLCPGGMQANVITRSCKEEKKRLLSDYYVLGTALGIPHASAQVILAAIL